MRDLFPKYIIEDGNLVLGKCTFHKELANYVEQVKGGGMYNFNHEKKTFTFYDDSYDFGKAKLEDVKKAVEEDKVFTNKYYTHSIATKFKFLYDTGSELIELN